MNKKFGAIILAAGQGTRMKADGINKVASLLGEKPIILHIVHFIQKLGISKIVTVIGHYKESVIKSLEKEDIIYAEQKKVLGSAHAVMTALPHLPSDVTDVMVVYGDDAILYANKNTSIIKDLLTLHKNKNNAITLLTIKIGNPFGLGRIVRGKDGNIKSIIEEKDATVDEKEINEINPGCFVFSVNFLKKYLPLIEKSPVTKEYYLTSLINLAVKEGKNVDTLQASGLLWRGVNTKEELKEAEKLYKELKN